jgi:hypothetical protein
VDEDQKLHTRVPRDLGGLRRGGVARLSRPLALLLAEGAIVDEHVGLVRRGHDRS